VRYALVGYGKMGRAIEAAAARRGHVLAAIVDRSAAGKQVKRSIDRVAWRGIGVAFEFTTPASAKQNVIALLTRGVPVVCGTTGWDPADTEVQRAARAAKSGAVVAPNYSVGMALFYGAVSEAARRYLAVEGYDPWVAEWHHKAKLDAPSGTALRLAKLAGVPAVAAVRAGHEPGRHVVGFDGPHDAVTLEHVARGRSGFAEGAVIAAEWLLRRRGIHRFEEVVEELVSPTKRRGKR
jgi:4-hydroxy-tetrahydrodipicolinate reductase